MNGITGLQDWFQTPAGRYLLAWERDRLELALANIFGFHALQLGLTEMDALSTNRMPHRWLAAHAPTPTADLVTDFAALPFPAASLDLAVLPHTLEFCADPHATLREVERVLVPEGRVVISGLNPASLWGLRERPAHLYHRLGLDHVVSPRATEFIGYWRLRDWLRLLGFEVESVLFGCYRPPFASQSWLQRFEWLEWAGNRWWPIFGAVYFVVAVKRVRGLTLLSPTWKNARALASAPVSIANSTTLTGACGPNDTKSQEF
jgi:SAM-dependent methyltransferase